MINSEDSLTLKLLTSRQIPMKPDNEKAGLSRWDWLGICLKLNNTHALFPIMISVTEFKAIFWTNFAFRLR